MLCRLWEGLDMAERGSGRMSEGKLPREGRLDTDCIVLPPPPGLFAPMGAICRLAGPTSGLAP